MTITIETIRSAFADYISDSIHVAGKRLELEKLVKQYNEQAHDDFINSIDFSDNSFADYLTSNRYFETVVFIETESGNATLSENVKVKVDIHRFLSDKVTKQKYDNIALEVKPACDMLRGFMNGFIRTENIVSIRRVKEELEPIFKSFGFAGHITSENIKAVAVHFGRVDKTLASMKQYKLIHLLRAFEMIDARNRKEQSAKQIAIETAMIVLQENGYTVEKQGE